MTLEEVFDSKAHNEAEIDLFRQGVCYRAYERSCVALGAIKNYATEATPTS